MTKQQITLKKKKTWLGVVTPFVVGQIFHRPAVPELKTMQIQMQKPECEEAILMLKYSRPTGRFEYPSLVTSLSWLTLQVPIIIVYALSIIVYPLSIHCLSIVYPLSIHFLYIVYPLSFHSLYIVYWLSNSCLFIVYQFCIDCQSKLGDFIILAENFKKTQTLSMNFEDCLKH